MSLTVAALHRRSMQLIMRVVRPLPGQECMQALLLRRSDLVSAMLLDATTELCRTHPEWVTARPPAGTLRQLPVPTIRIQARPLTRTVNSVAKVSIVWARWPVSVMWLSILDLGALSR